MIFQAYKFFLRFKLKVSGQTHLCKKMVVAIFVSKQQKKCVSVPTPWSEKTQLAKIFVLPDLELARSGF